MNPTENLKLQSITKDTRTKIIEKAFLIRLVEEKLLALFLDGKINGTVHTCIGQELIGVCSSEHLQDNDYVLSNHRGHGHLLSRDNDLVGFFAELMGKEKGICGGMGGSQHLYKPNHLSNGLQGGMTPIGAGIALANKIKKDDNIVVCYIGDGTLGEGTIYEAFNLAAIWDLPIVYVLENNRIAQSTSFEQTFAGSTKKRAEGFGLHYLETNIWDIEDMVKTFEHATSLARNEQKAVFLEIDVYRLYSHSKGDDNRNPDEIAAYKLKDILNQEAENNPEEITALRKHLQQQIDDAAALAEKLPTLEKIEQNKQLQTPINYSTLQEDGDGKRINELIHESLKTQFTKHANAVMIGEDIEYLSKWSSAPYGGAFKVSKDLSDKFDNVRNTPISEAAITGIGTGLAIGGMLPIVEIMFGDFMTLTFDQIFNHACKFNKMFNGQIDIPLVVRTPMGGKRGYGPTHSQSIEKHFLGINDLSIVALNHRISPLRIYEAVFAEKIPSLVIENKVLYTKQLQSIAPLGYTIQITDENYPTLKITPDQKKADLTIVCYGEMLGDVEKAVELAFEEEEILCEIICPSRISPLNITPILESVTATNRLLTVEEGSNVAAYSSEIAALLMENNIQLSAFKRISNNEIIPSSFKAEMAAIPNTNSIFEKIKVTYNGK